MRHLWSLIAGLVAAPLAWLLLATGQHRSQQVVEVWDGANSFDTTELVGPVAFLAVAGIMLGVLGTLRWSPAGPVTAGVLLVLPTAFLFVNPFRTLDAFFYTDQPRRLLGQDLEPWLPVTNGTMLVLGALLLVAVFSAHRWKQWPTQPAPIPPASDQEVVAGISALTDSAQPASTSGTAPAAASGSGTSGKDSGTSGKDRPAATPMTDDEILAAAAAFERGESGAGGPATGAGAQPASQTGGEPATGSAKPKSPTKQAPTKQAKSSGKQSKPASPKQPGPSADPAEPPG